MTTFLDTSVLIPLLIEHSDHHAWCHAEVEKAASSNPPIVISDIVYAEFSAGMNERSDVDAALSKFALDRCGYSDEVLFRASRAFLAYKANKGPKDGLLPDFLVGALAAVTGDPLLTRDHARIRTYFPEAVIIHPEAEEAEATPSGEEGS